jgi:molybdopterin synthase catalytic subunit
VAQPSIVVRVASAHRPAAFAASAWIMDELKRVVPIWKHPVFKDNPSDSVPKPNHRSAALS